MSRDPEIDQALDLHSHDMRIPRDATFPSLTRPVSFDVYAHAYWLAAKQIFEANWGDDGMPPTPDFLVMPVLFLIHQYIELELKEIVRMSFWVGQAADKSVQNLPSKGSHGLTDLLDIAEGNLKEISPDEMSLLAGKSKNIIEDLEKFGSRGEGLRYPETKLNRGSSPTISESYVADVRAVMTAMNPIRDRFNGCIGWLHSHYQL